MKKFLKVTLLILSLILPTMAAYAEETYDEKLYDVADLLSDEEEAALEAKLEEISERQEFDVIVIYANEIPSGYDVQTYADDVYDYYGFGFGEDHDGAMLLVSMAEHEAYITTAGYGIYALTDYGIELILDDVTDCLGDGLYADAVDTFADKCDAFVTRAREGDPVDIVVSPAEKEPFNWGTTLSISAIISFFISSITGNSMKGNLKSVKRQSNARNYAVPGSLRITEAKEIFMTTSTSRVPRAKAEGPRTGGSAGGSTTHVSHSGVSHGGGGRKF